MGQVDATIAARPILEVAAFWLRGHAAEVKSAPPILHAAPLNRRDGQGDDPQPGMTIHDPACGTAAFCSRLEPHEGQTGRCRPAHAAQDARGISGVDIVPDVVRSAP